MIPSQIKYILFTLLAVTSTLCCAQNTDSTDFRKFGTLFRAKPKLFSISLKSVQDFSLNTASDETTNEKADVSENLRRDVYLRFPCYIKNGTIIGLNLRYRHERFRFSNASKEDYKLFQNLEDNGLRSTGFDAILRRKDKKERTLTAKLGFRLNGDSFNENGLNKFLKVSFFAIRTHTKNKYTNLGYGLSAGYDLGIPVIYPVFVYQHYFNQHLSVDLNLPKKASLIYGFSDKTFLTWTTEISGASYHVARPLLDGFNNLELRKSEVRSFLRFEQEIYDFLWFGAELGGMQYLNFFVSKPKDRRQDAIINLETDPAYFFKIGVFLVPPKKVYNDIMGR
ncbi:MAG: hypothetical protein ACI85I_002100 [Arenicella sp.]|jgi:hypothetical protein